MRFARWVFLVAGIYGVLALAPGFFLEGAMNAAAPPAITHPEFYYGFIGSALVWQIAFFVIASDPAKYRPLIAVSVLEKLAFFGPCLALYALGRLPIGGAFIGGMIDGFWLVMFAIAWLRTKPAP
ncbi:MAG TPA: hypothetical protein VG983_10975 [Caulobacterales bacterium]|jgi:hypothetical protein|nr:hypothetical protein [Caulobacterales bacterium]